MALVRAFVFFIFCIFTSNCAVPMMGERFENFPIKNFTWEKFSFSVNQRPSDPNLLINKLQGAFDEFSRGDIESAIGAALDNLKGDFGDVMAGVLNNVLLPAETDAEIIEDEVLQKAQIETPQEVTENNDDDDVSSEVIRYNSKGESIENPKAQTGNAVGCHDAKEKKVQEAPQKPSEKSKSSSVEEHVVRFDSDGNSIEKFVEQSTESEEMVQVKRKNKKVTNNSDEILSNSKKELDSVLSKQVVDNQLMNMRQMDSDESAFAEDDDIPVITIPMGKYF
jgi:hypothetical protein